MSRTFTLAKLFQPTLPLLDIFWTCFLDRGACRLDLVCQTDDSLAALMASEAPGQFDKAAEKMGASWTFQIIPSHDKSFQLMIFPCGNQEALSTKTKRMPIFLVGSMAQVDDMSTSHNMCLLSCSLELGKTPSCGSRRPQLDSIKVTASKLSSSFWFKGRPPFI